MEHGDNRDGQPTALLASSVVFALVARVDRFVGPFRLADQQQPVASDRIVAIHAGRLAKFLRPAAQVERRIERNIATGIPLVSA